MNACLLTVCIHHHHLHAGFYWIPTLAGPTSLDNRGVEWLFPLVDGAPPIGWEAASHYLVLPVLLVLCQYVSSAIISPPIDPNAENANTQRLLYAGLPLMVGWFALNVPSGEQAGRVVGVGAARGGGDYQMEGCLPKQTWQVLMCCHIMQLVGRLYWADVPAVCMMPSAAPSRSLLTLSLSFGPGLAFQRCRSK